MLGVSDSGNALMLTRVTPVASALIPTNVETVRSVLPDGRVALSDPTPEGQR